MVPLISPKASSTIVGTSHVSVTGVFEIRRQVGVSQENIGESECSENVWPPCIFCGGRGIQTISGVN